MKVSTKKTGMVRQSGVSVYLNSRKKWIVLFTVVYVLGLAAGTTVYLKADLSSFGDTLPEKTQALIAVLSVVLSSLAGITVFSPFADVVLTLYRGAAFSLMGGLIIGGYIASYSVQVMSVYFVTGTLIAIWMVLSCSESCALWNLMMQPDTATRDIFNVRTMFLYFSRQILYIILTCVFAVFQVLGMNYL
ncbi:MAG: hypothetical protein AB9835_03510 [Eubacteriales bacterium]